MSAPLPSIPTSRWLLAGGLCVVGVGLALVRSPKAPGERGGLSVSVQRGSEGQTVEAQGFEVRTVSATIQAPGTLQAGSETGIGAKFEGTVLELLKDTGDPVVVDEVVFRLDPIDKQQALGEAEVALEQAQASAEEAEAELEEARRVLAGLDDPPEELVDARLMLRQKQLQTQRASAQLAAAASTLDRARTMSNEGIGRRTEVESAEAEHRVAELSEALAREELALADETVGFREQTWVEERAQAAKTLVVQRARTARARADVRARELELARAQREVEQCEVRSPIDGVITDRGVNLGDLVTRITGSEAHYIISDLGRMFLYADVDEGDVVRLKRGQPATVWVNALGREVPLEGKVYDVGYRAREDDGVSTFRTRVLLDPEQPALEGLRPGMTGETEIEVARAEEARAIPLRAVVQREVQELAEEIVADPPLSEREDDALVELVWVVVDGVVEGRVLELGVRDAEWVEVVSGLEEGEPVVTGPFRALESLGHGASVRVKPPSGDGGS